MLLIAGVTLALALPALLSALAADPETAALAALALLAVRYRRSVCAALR